MKSKHNVIPAQTAPNINPTNINSTSNPNAKGRGRPKKKPEDQEDPDKSEPILNDIFTKPENCGGPLEPTLYFEDAFKVLCENNKDKVTKYENYQKHPLYTELEKFSIKKNSNNTNSSIIFNKFFKEKFCEIFN